MGTDRNVRSSNGNRLNNGTGNNKIISHNWDFTLNSQFTPVFSFVCRKTVLLMIFLMLQLLRNTELFHFVKQMYHSLNLRTYFRPTKWTIYLEFCSLVFNRKELVLSHELTLSIYLLHMCPLFWTVMKWATQYLVWHVTHMIPIGAQVAPLVVNLLW